MSKIVKGLKYAESHEWVKVEDNIAVIGISDYAQHELGNITYVDMPAEGEEFAAGDEFGAVESTKIASDLYAPVSGTVVEVNTALEDAPELINSDPYSNWIIKIDMSDPSEVADLLDADVYETMCK